MSPSRARVFHGLLVFAALLLVVPATTLGKKPENRGRDKHPEIVGYVTASPNPLSFPGEYRLSGSGFVPNQTVEVDLDVRCEGQVSGTSTTIWKGNVDDGGQFSVYRSTESCPGTYVFTATQYDSRSRAVGSVSYSLTVE